METYTLPRNPTRDALLAVFIRPRRLLTAWRDADAETTWILSRLTIPVLVFSVLGAGIAHELIPGPFPAYTRPDPVGFAVYSGVTQITGVLALAVAAHYLCDLFQGYSDLNRAIAAVSVAMIPAWIGNIVAALPWPIGAHGALLLIAYSLVLLYAAFKIIMGIKRGHRFAHYIASLFAALLITFAFGWQAVSIIPGAAPEVRLGTTWLI